MTSISICSLSGHNHQLMTMNNPPTYVCSNTGDTLNVDFSRLMFPRESVGLLNRDTLEIFRNNSGLVLIPIENIRQANSIYFFQLNQLNLYKALILVKEEQIQNYISALRNSEIETLSYQEAYNICLQIIDEKDSILELRRKERIILGSVIVALISYITFN